MVELTPQRGRAWAHYALVAALAAVSVFWRLGGQTLEEHECHVALVAQTMADRNGTWLVPSDQPYRVPPHTTLNHWMIPVENGQPRLVKTPLPYWTAAGVFLLSEASTWTARLPSALSAVALALVTLAIGRRLLTPRAGLLGAILLVSSLSFQMWGRDARPEMMLSLWGAVSMGCFYMGLHATGRGRRACWMIAFWLSMGVANLAKEIVPLMLFWPLLVHVLWRRSNQDRGDGPARRLLGVFLIASAAGLALQAVMVRLPALHWWTRAGLGDTRGTYITTGLCLGLPMLWYFAACRGWRAVLPLLPTAIPGAILMAAVFVPWMWYMKHLFPDMAGGIFAEQVTDRAAGTGRWQTASFQIYAVALVAMTVPWTAFLPGALAAGLMKRFHAHRSGLLFLLLWSIGLVGLFTATAAKRDHYILPMISAFCLLIGYVVEDVFFTHQRFGPRVARLIGVGYGLVGVGALVLAAGMAATGHRGWSHMLVPVALAAVPAALAGCLAWRGRFRFVPGLLVAAGMVAFLGYWGSPTLDEDRKPVVEFARQTKACVHDDPVYCWNQPPCKLVFSFGRTIPAAQWAVCPCPPEANDRLLLEYLRQRPSEMPWIMGYADTAQQLAPLGYRLAFQVPDVEQKRRPLTLYHRIAPPTSPSQPGGG